jgi:hypothetical protein
MELSKLDRILINMETAASFRTLDSSIKLSGDTCKLILDYIKELENKLKESEKK